MEPNESVEDSPPSLKRKSCLRHSTLKLHKRSCVVDITSPQHNSHNGNANSLKTRRVSLNPRISRPMPLQRASRNWNNSLSGCVRRWTSRKKPLIGLRQTGLKNDGGLRRCRLIVRCDDRGDFRQAVPRVCVLSALPLTKRAPVKVLNGSIELQTFIVLLYFSSHKFSAFFQKRSVVFKS